MSIAFEKHLFDRGLRHYHNAYVDYEQEIVTFYIWCGTKLVGYQRYHWREQKTRDNLGKYYTYVSKPHRQCACWGTDDLLGYGPLFIVEGIWDAVRIKNCWRDSLALLTNQPSKQLRWWLRNVFHNRTIIAILDNDENKQGLKLAKAADKHFVVPKQGTDIGDMSDDEAAKWLEEISESPS
jgi:hypothetical protein